MNLNQATICGRLGKEPEMRYTAGGTAVCNFSLAVSSWVKKKEEEGYDEIVTWIDVTCWGKTAERAAQQATKGTEVLCVGRIDTRSWDDQNDPGKKHYRTFVTALNVQFGHGRVVAEGQGEESQAPPAPPAPPAGTTTDTPPPTPPSTAAEEEDDLPF